MSDYLSDFVQDSHEQITALNNSLLTLERSPDDEEALQRIFRAAHTLKGNCGAMGLERASDLAHAIEDLLDDVRAGDAEVSPALMDTVFDGVDELEAMIDEAGSTGQIQTDPTETIEALRAQIQADDEREPPALSPPSDGEIDAVLGRLEPPTNDDHDAYFVRLSIDDREDVNNGLLVLEALSDAFDVLGTEPPRTSIDAHEYERTIDAVFASPVERDAIAAALEPVDAVVDFEIVVVTDRFEAADDVEDGDELSTADASELSVDELLDEVSEFDDLDAMVEEVDDVGAFEEMGDAGTFDDLLGDDDLDELADEQTADAESDEDAADEDDEEVDDAGAVFAELQDEVEMVGFDELQEELDELEFDEFDDDEEVSMEELLGDDVDPEDDSFLVEDELDADDDVSMEELLGDDVTLEDEPVEPLEPEEPEPTTAAEAEAEAASETTDDADAVEAPDAPTPVDDPAPSEFAEAADVDDEFDEFDDVEAAEDPFGADEFADEVLGDDGLTEAGLAADADEFDEGVFGNDGFDSADPRFGDTVDFEDDSFDDAPVDPFESGASSTDTDDGFDDVDVDDAAFETPSTEFDPVDELEDASDVGDFESALDDRYASLPDVGFDEPDRPAVDPADDGDDGIQSVRVGVDQIDGLLTLVEGLVTSRVRLRHAFETGADPATVDRELDDLADLTTELQETVMDVRLVPLETVVNRLPRVVRDVSREQGKEVAFEMDGEDVELDRSILDEIGDPLIHMVRNAVDHGIEPPDVREEAGKPREGRVALRADRSRDRVTVEVEDDGAGLDPDRLRAEAVEAGAISSAEADALEDEEVYDLVFHPGLSTAEEVTDISGRGVGMDVVKRTIESLDGTIAIESEPGEGTTVTLTLPVTMAIEDVLFVESGGEEFGVPTKVISDVETVAAVELDERRGVVEIDDVELSVVDLAEVLEAPGAGVNGDGMVVRIRDEVRSVALHCDGIHGQQEVVVKPFEGFMSDIPGLSGATVRGRGEVVTILDVTSL